jgi:phage baseplate assembly protein W
VTAPIYRTFAFQHPDMPGPQGTGLLLRMRGDLAMVDMGESVRQAIFLLLTTIPGERVMRPDYGCDLHQLVFSPNDETTAGLAIYYVRRALDLFEPRAEVVRVDAAANPDDPGRLDVTLDYRVRATQQDGQLTISLNTAGGSAAHASPSATERSVAGTPRAGEPT